MVEEQENKIPLGYQLVSYEAEPRTYNLIQGREENYGIIREDINAHMTVTNKKGFGITVNKVWGDSKYTLSHDTIYIALFYEDSFGNLQFVEGTLRSLISPNTSVEYYFDDEKEAKEYIAMEVNPNTIKPKDWNGQISAVTDCQPYNSDSVTVLHATTLSGSEYEFDYSVSYEQGEIGGTGNNVRTDTITNSRDFLRIIKKSTSGISLSGAVFTLTDTTENTLLGTFTSDSDGLITNAYFTADHEYKLEEVSAPKGVSDIARSCYN